MQIHSVPKFCNRLAFGRTYRHIGVVGFTNSVLDLHGVSLCLNWLAA